MSSEGSDAPMVTVPKGSRRGRGQGGGSPARPGSEGSEGGGGSREGGGGGGRPPPAPDLQSQDSVRFKGNARILRFIGPNLNKL
jgi:hypothetical protein